MTATTQPLTGSLTTVPPPACPYQVKGRLLTGADAVICTLPEESCTLQQPGAMTGGRHTAVCRLRDAFINDWRQEATSARSTNEDYPMTDIDTLIHRIDQEIAADVKRQKAAWDKDVLATRERASRLQRFDTEAQHLMELVKPRLDAFVERFKAVVKAESVVRQHPRAVNLTFAATLAKATMYFEVFPDEEVNHVRLECTEEFIPVVVRCEKPPVLELPLGEVRDETVIQWFDDRIVAFVEAYLALVHQDTALQEQLKDHLVEDPIARIRFPKYLASSSLERDGQTYYFVDEDTRREFEQQPAAQRA